ncbi:MAG: CinA family nicotinamide mononucleotide deamidase-related protein, partial [Bacteroidota bacterium]
MTAYIITIGDELLIGQITDTNSAFMSAALHEEGVEVIEQLSVSDTRTAIRSAIDRAFSKADVVLMTGGLGPTKDDITKLVLAEYFSTELVFHAESWERLGRIYRQFGREPMDSHRQQCFLPAAAEILPNKLGTAPGMLLRKDGKILVSMPGVPYEMRYLVEHEVIPRLQAMAPDRMRQRSLTILTAGEGESRVAEKIESVEDSLPEHMSLAYLPNLGTVRLRLTTRGTDDAAMQEELQHYQSQIEELIGHLVYGTGKKTLSMTIGELLQERGLTLGTTESCTGGRIAQMLTSVAGSSAYFYGSVVAYDNRIKRNVLGVKAATLEQHGAVSEETIREMVAGGLDVLETDLVLATTGIAGPGGGTPTKPVGTIWIAVGNKDRIQT